MLSGSLVAVTEESSRVEAAVTAAACIIAFTQLLGFGI